MTQTTTEAKPAPPAKPIKLRSACNACFSAKVRCDGNKEGCRRCSDKHLDCHYSESRVGKVVGKRRKRPLPGAAANVATDNWNVKLDNTLPSPTSSDVSFHHFGSVSSWDPMVFDEPNMFNFADCDPSMDQFRMPARGFPVANDSPMFVTNGLPTPGMSPNDMWSLSPTAFESTSPVRSTAMMQDPSKIFTTPKFAPQMSRDTEVSAEDDETICIRLLTHLKKNCNGDRQSYDAQLSLIQKVNAAIRRILKSNKVRSDYACQLLLSAIAMHLVTMCENLLAHDLAVGNDFLQDQFALDATAEYFETPLQPPQAPHDFHDSVKTVIHEAGFLSSAIGDMLIRHPGMESYQQIGRHETLHGELNLRMKKALMMFP